MLLGNGLMVERIDFGKVKVRIHNEALILLLNEVEVEVAPFHRTL
jgi:hypothetical protein